MEVIFILLPISLGLALIGLGGFLWCSRSGQFDDLKGSSLRILLDDEEEPH